MARRTRSNDDDVPIEPGDLNRSVTIQQMTEVVSDSRVPVEKWTPLSVVWMSKRDASLYEQEKSDQISAAFDTQWVMGYWSEMDPELVDVAKTRRLQYLNRIYQIVGAQLIGLRGGIAINTIGSSKVGA